MNINNDIFAYYYDSVDWMINSDYIGQNVTIYYPPIKIPCDACNHGVVGVQQNNIGDFGGPVETTCNLCNGNNTIDKITTKNIKLRIYWEKKFWIKLGNINIPNSDAMIIGFMDNLPDVESASYFTLDKNGSVWKFELSCKPFPHGFGKKRYFIGYVKQSA